MNDAHSATPSDTEGVVFDQPRGALDFERRKRRGNSEMRGNERREAQRRFGVEPTAPRGEAGGIDGQVASLLGAADSSRRWWW
jgi:hypothetical protein